MFTYNGEHTHKDWKLTHEHKHYHSEEGVDCAVTRHVHHKTAYDAYNGIVSEPAERPNRKGMSRRRILLDFMIWLGTQPQTVWLNYDHTLDEYLAQESKTQEASNDG